MNKKVKTNNNPASKGSMDLSRWGAEVVVVLCTGEMMKCDPGSPVWVTNTSLSLKDYQKPEHSRAGHDNDEGLNLWI